MTPERRFWPHHESCDIYDRPPECGRPATGDKPCNCYIAEITALTERCRLLEAERDNFKFYAETVEMKDEELKRLKLILKHAPHTEECDSFPASNRPCTCWLKEAEADLKDKK